MNDIDEFKPEINIINENDREYVNSKNLLAPGTLRG